MGCREFDVVVVGAGHAGCEAALAAARLGCRTALLTMARANVGLMPCNPSIGGPAKGHLVREIDALGGEMARAIDRTFIQIRMLNTGKGPAVQAMRAQADKALYGQAMLEAIDRQDSLELVEGLVDELRSRPEGGFDIVCEDGSAFAARAVVLTTGTSLAGRCITGEKVVEAGRFEERAATRLSENLKLLGFRLGRLKTGTPPRLRAGTIAFSQLAAQPGSALPLYFSFAGPPERPLVGRPNPVYPQPGQNAWRPQMHCYSVHTTAETHAAIRANLHRAPMFNGVIEGVGPRYCPSIEDKVVRFADKTSHHLFLEPEGWETDWVYLQGANTSLPEDAQDAMVASIPGLERAEILRYGYAVEYDFVRTDQTQVTLETKRLPGLFLAGQVNGTSGYEEAAAQGLIAGINAAHDVLGRQPLVLRRDQAYIGVMLDDLVSRDLTEPYRMFTSRCEYRLLLRQDNADIRLTPLAGDIGLQPPARVRAVRAKAEAAERELRRLEATQVSEFAGAALVERKSAAELLRRPEMGYATLVAGGLGDESLDASVMEQVEVQVKYNRYVEQHLAEIARVRRQEERRLPSDLDYEGIVQLRREARQALDRYRPLTLGQASRLEGVTPADVNVLLVDLERRSSTKQSSAAR